MISLTFFLDEKWLEKKRAEGVRVVRLLEKWAASLEGVTLKGSTGQSLTVEMEPLARPKFVEGLEARLGEFGCETPSEVLSYEGDGKRKKPAEPRTPAPDPAPAPESSVPHAAETKGDAAKEAAEPERDPPKVLEEVLSAVPACYSRDLAAYFREAAEVIPMLRRMDSLEALWKQNLLVAIDDGYGLTEFLESLARLYDANGLVPGGCGERTFRELRIRRVDDDRDPFEDWRRAVDVAKDMQEVNLRKGGGRAILCLDVSAWQNELATTGVKAYLRRLNANSSTFTCVFRVPFVEAHVFGLVEEALNDILNVRPIVVPPTDIDRLTDYARREFAKRAFSLDDTAVSGFEQWILQEKSDDSFFGYKTVDKMIGKAIYGKALANCRSGTLDRTVRAADVQQYSAADESEGDPEQELNELVGLAEVKAKIAEIVALIKAQRQMVKKGRHVRRPAIHMLFSGNPGTGKTTVARLVGRLLKREGVLRKGHFIEVRGRDLCGQYVGQTAPRTSAICRDAYGSVLFIDEAYSLFRGDGNDRDYGREALDTLVAEMENHRDDMCVIMAGYKDEMETMLGGNAGLASRIPYTIEFPDYTREEMKHIFFSMMNGNFDYERALEKKVGEFFDSIPDEALRSRGFSNARFVRNLYERTWGKAAYRSRLEDGDIKVLVGDLAGAMEEREFKELMEKTRSERRPIGFGI